MTSRTWIRTFAEAQLRTFSDLDVEVLPGVHLGRRDIPLSSVGCYVPGGRCTGGVWAGTFVKTVTHQWMTRARAEMPPGLRRPAAGWQVVGQGQQKENPENRTCGLGVPSRR